MASNPDQSAAALMPQAARANRSIFYSGGSPRSVGEVMSLMRDKVAKAYGDTPVPGAAPRIEHEFAGLVSHQPRTQQASYGATLSPAPLPPAARARPSMADTLRSTFGDSGTAGGRAHANIAAAYDKFRAFGL